MQAPPASGSKLGTVASVGADGALRAPGADHAAPHVACPFAPFAANATAWRDWDRSIDGIIGIVVVVILRWPSDRRLSISLYYLTIWCIAAYMMDVQV